MFAMWACFERRSMELASAKRGKTVSILFSIWLIALALRNFFRDLYSTQDSEEDQKGLVAAASLLHLNV